MTKFSLIKRLSLGGVLTVAVAMMGSEFTGSGGDNSFTSRGFGWVNFSGVYRAGRGGPLVTDFTAGESSGGTLGGTNFVNVSNEVVGEGNGVKTTFAGVLTRKPLVVGTLRITAGGVELVDQGDGTLVGFNSTGTIEYGNGAWSIDLNGGPLGNGEQLVAKYAYVVVVDGVPGSGGGGGQGSSGKAIVTLTVFQTGNKLEITDNNGAKYRGQIGDVRTTSGISSETDLERPESEDTLQPSIGDSAIAEFTAEGISAAGVNVMMTGTFQGVVSRGSTSTSALFFSNRVMLGVWVEPKITGDINGQASPIGITIAAPTDDDAVAAPTDDDAVVPQT